MKSDILFETLFSILSPVHLHKIPSRFLVCIVRAYQQLISPLLPPSCRFYPSCSAYCLEAVERYGAFKGSRLAVRRVLRCHPWHPGGVDPVPTKLPPNSVKTD